MKATIGAHGIVLAIMPNTTAVVPQEQSGVATAAPVAAITPARRCRSRNAETFSVSMNNFKAVAMSTLITKNGQLCCSVSQTC